MQQLPEINYDLSYSSHLHILHFLIFLYVMNKDYYYYYAKYD